MDTFSNFLLNTIASVLRNVTTTPNANDMCSMVSQIVTHNDNAHAPSRSSVESNVRSLQTQNDSRDTNLPSKEVHDVSSSSPKIHTKFHCPPPISKSISSDIHKLSSLAKSNDGNNTLPSNGSDRESDGGNFHSTMEDEELDNSNDVDDTSDVGASEGDNNTNEGNVQVNDEQPSFIEDTENNSKKISIPTL